MSIGKQLGAGLTYLDRVPGVSFVGLVLGVVGLVGGWWFYRLSLDSRQLIIVEPSVRSVLVDKELPAKLDVLIDGRPVTKQDVYAVQLAVWNSGNRSVKPEHVLAPIRFVPVEGDVIVDASVLRQTRDLCGIKPIINHADGTASIEWAILEPKDGAVIQLVLRGNKGGQIGVRGSIEAGGAPLYVRVASELNRPIRWSADISSTAVATCVIGIPICVFIGVDVLRDVPKRWRERQGKGRTLRVLLAATMGASAIAFGLLLALALIAYVVERRSVPDELISFQRSAMDSVELAAV